MKTLPLGTCSNTSRARSLSSTIKDFFTVLIVEFQTFYQSRRIFLLKKGELPIVLVNAQRELRFQNIPIGDGYCGQYDVNHPINEPEPVQSKGILSFNTSASSIIAFPAQNGDTIFFGLQEGTIKKVLCCYIVNIVEQRCTYYIRELVNACPHTLLYLIFGYIER